MDKCESCGAPAGELRRGRCWGCYSRWVEARPVGFGACCRVCGERRRSHLRSVELMGVWSPVCHECAAFVHKLEPIPQSLVALRDAIRRERRGLECRALQSEPDPGRARERRAGEQRTPAVHVAGARAGEGAASTRALLHFHDPGEMVVEDDMILELAELASELQAVADDLAEAADLTRIYDLGRQSERSDRLPRTGSHAQGRGK